MGQTPLITKKVKVLHTAHKRQNKTKYAARTMCTRFFALFRQKNSTSLAYKSLPRVCLQQSPSEASGRSVSTQGLSPTILTVVIFWHCKTLQHTAAHCSILLVPSTIFPVTDSTRSRKIRRYGCLADNSPKSESQYRGELECFIQKLDCPIFNSRTLLPVRCFTPELYEPFVPTHTRPIKIDIKCAHWWSFWKRSQFLII